MNLATKITLIRMILVPLFLVLILSNTLLTRLLALIIFLIGGISDTLDGIIARKQNSVTKVGTTMDPLADKLLITTALICFLGFRELNIPSWTIVVIVVRDYIITWLRSLDYDNPIPADKTAKVKTFLQNIIIIIILLILSFEKYLVKFGLDRFVIKRFPRDAMIFLSLFTLFSGIVYIIKYRKYIKEQFIKN